ncbi:hypothetical protein VCHA54P489_110035 [Vibrio chagasii]|nr:hypothetical protein VCHA54P489_110035 [Vibrio chagasii]CAH7075835.1 hypothetical protein VCHA49P380_10035 [Vibrio chagasii]CAH7436525.1 hypothetical protein VCHA37P202_90119 [Vibrio chagasii]
MWRDFRQQLSERNFKYQDLDSFMKADGIIYFQVLMLNLIFIC